jgi:hypothetical protein
LFAWAQTPLARLEASPRHHEWVTVDQTTQAKAFLVYPEVADKKPVVLLIHENRGLNDWARSMADQIAEMGYIALAPDFLSGKAPNGGGTTDFEIQMLLELQSIIWNQMKSNKFLIKLLNTQKKFLLLTKRLWSWFLLGREPILSICYTNHCY